MQAKLYFRILALALAMSFLLVVAGAVSAQQVTYNFMPGVDFTQFHTYKWVEIPGGIHPNQIVDQEIKQAVNSTLAGKGFTMVTGDTKADLYVWRGSAAQTLDPSGNQNKNMQKLDKAMNKLLKNFPPPQKK